MSKFKPGTLIYDKVDKEFGVIVSFTNGGYYAYVEWAFYGRAQFDISEDTIYQVGDADDDDSMRYIVYFL
jgi:hypothetical protein